MITRDQLATAVWGTGYGSRRHLVDHQSSRLKVPTFTGYSNRVRARCSTVYQLDFLDSQAAFEKTVLSKKPCVCCLKADAEATDA